VHISYLLIYFVSSIYSYLIIANVADRFRFLFPSKKIFAAFSIR